MPAGLYFLLLGLSLVAAIGCLGGDRSIVYTDSDDSQVTNGVAYDVAEIDAPPAARLIVPHDALVQRVACAERIKVALRKRLDYYGHPESPITIDEKRKAMGCAACRREDGAFLLCPYGNVEFSGHGSQGVQLALLVPAGITIERSDTLAVVSQEGEVTDLSDLPADGCWRVLSDHPAPELVRRRDLFDR